MFCYRKLAYLEEEIGKLMETKNNKRRHSVNLKKDKIIIFNQNNIYHEDFGNREDKEINKKDSSKSYKKDEKHNDKNDKKKKKERRKSKRKKKEGNLKLNFSLLKSLVQTTILLEIIIKEKVNLDIEASE